MKKYLLIFFIYSCNSYQNPDCLSFCKYDTKSNTYIGYSIEFLQAENEKTNEAYLIMEGIEQHEKGVFKFYNDKSMLKATFGKKEFHFRRLNYSKKDKIFSEGSWRLIHPFFGETKICGTSPCEGIHVTNQKSAAELLLEYKDTSTNQMPNTGGFNSDNDN
jgi:hypothetical protein